MDKRANGSYFSGRCLHSYASIKKKRSHTPLHVWLGAEKNHRPFFSTPWSLARCLARSQPPVLSNGIAHLKPPVVPAGQVKHVQFEMALWKTCWSRSLIRCSNLTADYLRGTLKSWYPPKHFDMERLFFIMFERARVVLLRFFLWILRTVSLVIIIVTAN